MGKIAILPDTLISQIAAGEVVDRPASVVKELVENSLDAGATHCAIEIEQGGGKLIVVRDNGCGIPADDAKMAFARHATSKISKQEDLSNIKSFGFRGEALAAIASVSVVTMKTRAANAESGVEIVYKGGKLESEGAVGCSIGTEIIVRNLFFNTPARKKFLKAEATELSHIAAAVSHLAVSNPSVAFELKHNGKDVLRVSAGTSAARLSEILGKNYLEEALSVSFKTPSIFIHGFIGKPGMALSSKRHQYLFVNGRDVSDPLVSRAVSDAYGSRLPARAWPLFILHIDIDPGEVDVNVHPRKLAVKFLDTQRIYRDVKQAVEQGLDESVMVSLSNHDAQNVTLRQAQGDTSVQSAIEFTQQLLESTKNPEGLDTISSHTILGQIANSYILILDEEGLAIVDQHAAHERILYEKFSKRTGEHIAESQQLLTPLTLECSKTESVFMKDAMDYLQTIGFEFDKWSGETFVIRACPASLQKENLEKIFRDFLDELSGEYRNDKKILPEKILKSLACKAAVKFGMPLSSNEQKELLLSLQKTPNHQTCPHGRPTKVLITFEELERKFYRRK